jgi:hypothetical protein
MNFQQFEGCLSQKMNNTANPLHKEIALIFKALYLIPKSNISSQFKQFTSCLANSELFYNDCKNSSKLDTAPFILLADICFGPCYESTTAHIPFPVSHFVFSH